MTKRFYSTIVSTLAATPVGLGNRGTNKRHELSRNRRRVMLVELDRLVADERLTPRKSEVAELVLRGFGNKVIARQLGLQVGTVKIHLHHIYRKLGVPNRTVFLLNTLSKKLSKSQSRLARG